MNDIVWAINPRNDSMEKIIQRMESFAKPLAAVRNMQFDLHYDEAVLLLHLPMHKRKNFYLIFKEAVNNAIKYSGAKQIVSTIVVKDNALLLQVTDDGVGFNKETEMNANKSSLSGIGTGTGAQGNIQLLNGNVGIGTAAPSSKLEVCGNVRVIGTIVASGTITTSAISCPSDVRYKKNITALINPVEKLMQVNGVQYNWRGEEFPNMNFNDKMQTGFIAQDLEKIFPEMVFTDDAGYKSIDYSRLTPVLVETIKEQQKEIKEMSDRLTAIEKLLKKH